MRVSAGLVEFLLRPARSDRPDPARPDSSGRDLVRPDDDGRWNSSQIPRTDSILLAIDSQEDSTLRLDSFLFRFSRKNNG